MDETDGDSVGMGLPPGVESMRVGGRSPFAASLYGLLTGAGRGARKGLRGVTIFFVPIAAFLFLLALAPTAFGFGAGRGFAIHPSAISIVAFVLICLLLGAIFGGFFGFIAAFLAAGRAYIAREKGDSTLNQPSGVESRIEFEPPVVRERPIPPGAAVRRPSLSLKDLIFAALGVVSVTIVAVPFGLGVYAGRYIDRRLAAAIAAANRDDPHWRLDDLMANRAAVPDEENSALIVEEVLAYMPESWPGGERDPSGGQTESSARATHAYDRIAASPPNQRLDDETIKTLGDELQTYDDAVWLARTLVDYRQGRHEVTLTPDLLSTPLALTQRTRSVARLLCADAAIRAERGDIDGALASCGAILRAGSSIGDEPFLVSNLVRIAICGVATTTIQRALAQGEPSHVAMAKLQSILLDELAQPLLLQGLRSERATMDELIRRIGNAELPIDALSGGGSLRDSVPAMSPWGRLMFDSQRAVGLEWTQQLIVIAKTVPHQRPPLIMAWERELNRVKSDRLRMWTAVIPLLFAPAAATAETADSRHRCNLAATVILLAAERHRQKIGHWPSTIAEIDPEFLPDPPLDPFTGQSFRMERRDGQLIVYSVGPNLTDEHGDCDLKRYNQGFPDDFGTRAWDVNLRRRPAE